MTTPTTTTTGYKPIGSVQVTSDAKEPIKTETTASPEIHFDTSAIQIEEQPEIAVPAFGIPEEEQPQPIVADLFTLDDSKFICESLWNLPAAIWGDHLILTDRNITNFATQLHRYCIRKGINPYDYLFDELPIIISGISLTTELRKKHIEHKQQEEKKLEHKKVEEDHRNVVSTLREDQTKEMEELI